MKTINKFLLGAALLLAPIIARADQPASAVSPRNATLTSLTAVTNLQVLTLNASTNLLLTAAYQHELAVFTSVTATNTGVGTNSVGSGAATYTNYFDLAKVVGGVTNWTTDQPIKATGTLNGLTPVAQAVIVPKTSFDGFELIRLTKTGHGATNTFYYTVVLGQTP